MVVMATEASSLAKRQKMEEETAQSVVAVVDGGGLSPPPQPRRVGFVAFWQSLVHASVGEDGRVLSLPDAYIAGAPSNGSKLYIRACYGPLVDRILHTAQSSPEARMVLLGTSGVGRSYFAWFLLWSLVRRGVRRVAYHSPDGLCMLHADTTTAVVPCGRDDVLHTEGADLWYIADSVEPIGVVAGPALVLPSINQMRSAICWLERGRGKARLYMPEWRAEEFGDMKRLVFPEVDETVPEHIACCWHSPLRTKFFGFSPRTTLAPNTDIVLEIQLTNEVVKRTTIRDLERSFIPCAEAADHRVISFVGAAEKDFCEVWPSFTSRYVQLLCCRLLMQRESPRDMQLFLLNPSPELHDLQEGLFEEIMHEQLAHGDDFVIRTRSSDTGELLHVPGGAYTWRSLNDGKLLIESGTFLRTGIKTDDSWDAITVLDLGPKLGKRLVGIQASFKNDQLVLKEVAVASLRSLAEQHGLQFAIIFGVPDFEWHSAELPCLSQPSPPLVIEESSATGQEMREEEAMKRVRAAEAEDWAEKVMLVLSIPIDADHISGVTTQLL
jgi:hypothetical protein